MLSHGPGMTTTMLTLALVAGVSLSAAGFVLLSSSSSTQSESGWRVVRSNVTVYGMPAYLGRCIAIAAWCPLLTPDLSLTVNLINYKGTYYYSYTHEYAANEYQSNSTVVVSQTAFTYTAWFTNTTLYCVTPAELNTAPITCPS